MKVIVVLQDAHGTFLNGLLHHVYCNWNHFRWLYGKRCTMGGVLSCLFCLFQHFSGKTFLVPSLPHYSPSSNCFSMNTHCISFYLINSADVMISIYFYPLQIYQNENCDQHIHLQPCFSRCFGNKHSTVPECELPDGYLALRRRAVQDRDVHWLLQHVYQYLHPHHYEHRPLHCCLPPG